MDDITGVPYNDSTTFDPSLFPAQGSGNALDANLSSNQLVRRNGNQQLAARNRPEEWQEFGGAGPQPAQPWEMSDEDDLDAKALAAKKDAQAKRKQIPPFVQKLSSFLDESKNTELIRWSDDGNSFIVLDEDEFANTLIPELFKHNNYASFVRQLNMYGFHKKVGLSDNSMNASANKRKTPSEYFNKYFKRGRSELLWLIQKPKPSQSSAKRKRTDEKGRGDSDDDTKAGGQITNAGGQQELAQIPKSELAGFRQEVQQLKQQQRYISSLIGQIKRQNDQLYQQATAFQNLHDRHENSIQAILTFLATFYNRSLQGQNANLPDMFGHAMPQNMQQQGNVVDVGDYPETEVPTQGPPQQRPPRRPFALLPAPPVKDINSPMTDGRVSNDSPSARNTVSPKPRNQQFPASIFRAPSQSSSAQQSKNTRFTEASSAPSSPNLKEDKETPDLLSQLPETTPAQTPGTDDIMSVINAANANTPNSSGPQFDFNAALNHFQNANGAASLTPQQRDQMINSLMQNAGADNSALTTSQSPQMPDLSQFTKSQDQLDFLQRLQGEHANRLEDLTNRLTPLSPNGTIPGLASNGNAWDGQNVGAPGEYDLNNWVEGDDYFPDQKFSNPDGTAADGDDIFNDLDLNLDNYQAGPSGFGADAQWNNDPAMRDQDMFGGLDGINDDKLDVPSGPRVESISSEATSPANTVVTDDGGLQATRGAKSPGKRRKVS
ncbi:hypothetical protein K402DRAFT_342713 [Aulographum hederae CBS 113979]|uniref:HSF-type DNA-binding domain-containing protein n=1 Tax=Aulographum hederae CBS 113979 TaxID=1176131 RepID=A0A6G1GK19_9PEZI|nr:hypothetical protein K402DRAFT_342713 [Aulographum hederae CBS 113979]